MFRISFISSAILKGAREYSKRSPAIHTRTTKQKISVPKPIQRSRNAVPLITCKRPEFDLYKEDPVPQSAEFNDIPLASAGWQHYKSKHDYFIIHRHIDPESEAEKAQYSHPFDKFNFDPQLLENLRVRLNIERTTYIQYHAIPQIQTEKHTLIAAETGCGKTIAYLLPILQSILERKRKTTSDVTKFNSPLALILTPGRELGKLIFIVNWNLKIYLLTLHEKFF